MIARPFGPLERSVPVIGQGTWNVPLRAGAADAARRALQRGIELGMTHLDTAEMYGDGGAETLLGEAIRGIARDSLFVVSKVLPSNASARGVMRACDQSLRRMGLDYFDCYLLHWRGSTPLAETMGALEALVDAGKIRSLGVSNFDVDDLDEARTALRKHPIVCNQVLYHLGERTIEAHEIPYCREHEIAITAYTPFGRGDWSDAKGAHELERIAAAHGVTTHAVILAFLTRDPIVFTIPKAATVAHVESNAAAADLVLNADEIAAIDAAYPARKRRGGIPTL